MTTLVGTQVEQARFLALRQALRLEMRGLKASTGRTAYSILKNDFGLVGSRQKVLDQCDVIREQILGEPTK